VRAWRRRTFLQSLAAPLLAQPDRLTIVDRATGKSLSARVLARDSSGGDYIPEGAVEVPISHDRWFVYRTPINLPDRPFNFRIEHGTEYRPLKTTSTHAALERWIDMRSLGYSCGEDHLHVAAGSLAAMLDAEGLDFGASLEWWNGPKLEVPPHPDPRISPYDAEVENAWGAVYLNGLREPISIPWDTKRSNLPFVREARRQEALIAYQGGWSREVLLDALLGYVDVVNICNNNFHRYRYQPRPQNSNLLGVPGFPEYPDTAEGMMLLNMESYYRLLNCGLRLAAGAGSATGAKTTPAGYNRSYVLAGRNSTIEKFHEAWRNGRNFVTNGPMIFLTVDGSHIKAMAICDQPLRSLDVIVNGEVIASGIARVETKLAAKGNYWVAARATAEDRFLTDAELAQYHSESGRGGERPTRLRFGHTSPVYIGGPVRVKRSVQEARRMLDAFERFATAASSEQYRAEILAGLPTARAKLG
jgi:hypothetical protein